MLRKLFFIVLIIMFFIIDISHASICKRKFPKDVDIYIPMIESIVYKYMPNFKPWQYFPALIEHETCITLCSKRCFNPKARLKTRREEGGGLGQITRVFRKNGMVKWDMLATLKRWYPKELSGLTWDNLYDRPDLQIKALVLLWRRNYNMLPKTIKGIDRIAFADSMYNGGYYWLRIERSICKLRKNCDPNKWFGNVEKIKSRRARRKLYGNRSAWDINRHHVRDVIKIRLPKYLERYRDVKQLLNELGYESYSQQGD